MADLNELATNLARANALAEPLIHAIDYNEFVFGDLLETDIDTCVQDLITSLAQVRSFSLYESSAAKATLQLLVKPVLDASSALAQITIPDPAELADLDNAGDFVKTYLKQVGQSLTNPFLAMIQMQESILVDSLDQITQTFLPGDGVGITGAVNEYVEKAKSAVWSLLLNPNGGADMSLAGLIVFAISEAIPAIDAELEYLAQMKKLLRTALEDSASLPDSIEPQLPNLAINSKLCDAEKLLTQVSYRLRQENTFDRKSFNAATKNVCASRDLIFDGSVDADFAETHLGNFSGLSELAIKDILRGKFLPDVTFQLNLVKLNFLLNAFERQDDFVYQFHINIQGFLDNIRAIADVQLGDIISLLVDTLRRQVSAVRATLEAQGQGYNGYQDAMYADVQRRIDAAVENGESRAVATARESKRLDPFTKNVFTSRMGTAADRADEVGGFRRASTPSYVKVSDLVPGVDGEARKHIEETGRGWVKTGQRTDIYAYISSQAGAYVVLSGLCFLMERTDSAYRVLQGVLSTNNRIVSAIKGMLNDLAGDDCPSPPARGSILQIDESDPYNLAKNFTYLESGVVLAVDAFVRAAQDRVAGGNTKQRTLVRRAQRALETVEKQEAWLQCFKSHLFLGNESVLGAVSAVANGLSLLKNTTGIIRGIMKQYGSVRAMLRNLDMKKLFGIDGERYNVFDTLLQALQCLVLRCDDPSLTSLLNRATTQFRPQADQTKSAAVTMGSLDDIPKTGQEAAANQTIQSIFRLISSLQSLTTIDLKKLCDIENKALEPTPNEKLDAELAKILAQGEEDRARHHGSTDIPTQVDERGQQVRGQGGPVLDQFELERGRDPFGPEPFSDGQTALA